MSAFDKAWVFLKEKKRNILWMGPDYKKTPVGWIDDGHGPFIDMHKHPDYPHGFNEYVAGHEDKGPLPWKNHEIVDGEVQEKDLSGPVPGLPGMSFDAKGNLVGGQ
jgi:hypothetical protein